MQMAAEARATTATTTLQNFVLNLYIYESFMYTILLSTAEAMNSTSNSTFSTTSRIYLFLKHVF